MRHFDAHAYRTEDAEGVWDFARGCMRTYLILAEKARRFRDDAEIQAALVGGQGARAGRADRARGLGARRHRRTPPRAPRRGRAGGAGLRPRAARPARDRAAARRPVADGRSSPASTSRRSPPRWRCATPTPARCVASGRAPHPPVAAAPQRAGPGGVVGGLRAGVGRGRRAGGGRHRRRRPAARHGRARRRPATVVRPAKLWNDTESAPDAGWLLKQLPDGAAGWAAACGTVPVAAFTITKLSWLHRSEPEHVGPPGAGAPAPRLADLPADRRVHHRPGRRLGHGLLVAGGGRVPLGPAGHRRQRPRLVAAPCPRCWARPSAAGSWRGAVVGPGTGDNMAAALGLGLATGRRRHLDRHVGHGLRRQRHADGRRDRATWPGSPTPPAASCPSCARSTPPR